MSRGLTIHFRGHIPASTPSESMDLFLAIHGEPAPGGYYLPTGNNALTGGNSSTGPNANVYIPGRNYNITSWYIRARDPADDDFEIFHLYVNASDSGIAFPILNGTQSNFATGLTIPITAGDEICLRWDAGSDSSCDGLILTIHLEPR